MLIIKLALSALMKYFFFFHARIKIGMLKIRKKMMLVKRSWIHLMKMILIMRRNLRLVDGVKLDIVLNLVKNENFIMEPVDREEGNRLLKMMSPQLRTLIVTVMRVSRALEGKVYRSVKAMVGVARQQMLVDEIMRYAPLVGLFGRCHMLKAKKVRRLRKPRRSPKR